MENLIEKHGDTSTVLDLQYFRLSFSLWAFYGSKPPKSAKSSSSSLQKRDYELITGKALQPMERK